MSNGSKGWRVRCQTCGCTDLYVTTEHYNPNIPLTGDMLGLQKLYKDWPIYDGSLAVKSTSRFLLFCSKCAGYVSTTGKLKFADFPDTKVTVISKERSEMGYNEGSEMGYNEESEFDNVLASFISNAKKKAINNMIIPNVEDSALSDDPQRDETPAVSPEDLIKEMEKQGNISRSGRSGKKGKRK